MQATTTDEKREVLERVIELMDECAQLLRSLDDPHIEAYCLAAFEGRNGGWLGRFERDIIERTLETLDEDDEDEGEEA